MYMPVQVRVAELSEIYKYAVEKKEPVLVTGESGIGKTEKTNVFADEYGGKIDVRFSQLDPSDLKGVPYMEDGLSFWAVPDILPQAERDGEKGVLIWDEYLDAKQDTMMGGQQLILERRLGGYHLPDGWIIIALGNRKQHGGVNRGLSSAQQDRFMHFEAVMDIDDLKDHFIKKQVDPIVISFLHLHGGKLAHHLPEKGSDEWAWPTPRSWERLSHIRKQSPSKALRHALYSSLVGEGAAVQFIAHEDIAVEVPDPDDCINNPMKAMVPENPSAKYAIACSLGGHATSKNFENIAKYIGRLPGEFSILTVKGMNPEVMDCKAFGQWAMDNEDILLG